MRGQEFAAQAKAFNDARDAYYAHTGCADEYQYYLAYEKQMREWGANYDRIWKKYG
jgi:hypothetical protein